MSLFCSSLTGQFNQISPFGTSFVNIISFLNLSRSTLNPSQFLRFLREVFIRSGKQYIDLFQQPNASEILPVILNKLCNDSLNTFNPLTSLARNTFTSSVFLQMFRKRESSDNITNFCFKFSSIFHRSFPLENKFICNFCSQLQQALLDHEFASAGHLLMIQLKRCLNINNFATKHAQTVCCTSDLDVSITVHDDIIHHEKFKLIATINHSGNLNRGHYKALIKNANSSGNWPQINDAAVTNGVLNFFNDKTSYVLLMR